MYNLFQVDFFLYTGPSLIRLMKSNLSEL